MARSPQTSMLRPRWLQCRRAPAVGMALALWAASQPLTAVAQRSCDEWHATLASVEGVVEVQRQSAGVWLAVHDGDFLCTEDSLRVQHSGRALLTLPDGSQLRLDGDTSFRLPEPPSGIGTIVDLIRGAIHVISRDPRSLTFHTPYFNAGLEGTEFGIRVADAQATVSVLEGQVVASNANGTVHVPSGYVATAGERQRPQAVPGEPVALMRWTAYYAQLLDGPLPAPDQEPTAAEATNPEFFSARAAARLSRGRLAAAEEDLAIASRYRPESATVRALESVVAVAQARNAEAMALAEQAVDSAPGRAVPWLALSYAQQASGDVAGALKSSQHAAKIDTSNAIARSRVAELELAAGDLSAAMDAADRAIALRPDLGYPHTVVGFAELARLDSAAATAAFRRASQLDQGAPLPHLGWGLALVLDGDLDAGRRQIEEAVALDPGSATLRSYMAKTYAAENREKLTKSQLALAKRFDPTDPTPWLYDTFHQLNDNRPVDALQNLLAAISLNGDRLIFRSRLGMDQDQATRSAGLGRVYRELGFEQLALVRGWQALSDDPTDHAAHRLLADVYSTAPRHEIVRVNELLQSELLQPINLRPIRPDLASPNWFILDAAGPGDRSFTEFSPLLAKNGLRFQGSTVSGGNNTSGDDLVLSGVHDRLSYSVGQFRFATDGFRENNDFDQRTANAFVQFRPNEATSLQAELRSTDADRGDIAFLFDQFYEPQLRLSDSADSLRLGLRRDVSEHGTLLASLISQDVASVASFGSVVVLDVASRGHSLDVQHIRRFERWSVRSGVLLSREQVNESRPLPSATVVDSTRRQSAVYSYGELDLTPAVTLTIGGSYDSFHDRYADKSALNPKLGLTWRPTARTTLRAARFTTLEGSLSQSKTALDPRLEPGQVAGFSQFLLGANGDESTVGGMAVDHQVSDGVFLGAELSERDYDRLLISSDPQGMDLATDVHVDEKVRRGYLYWTPLQAVSFSAQYQQEDVRDRNGAFYSVVEVHTRRLPLEARYFAPSGLMAGFRASHVAQHGLFQVPTPPGFPDVIQPGADRFWIFDASLGYRLPKRRGLVSLNVGNLLDRRFHFQDTDPENPSFLPERMVSLKVTLAFE